MSSKACHRVVNYMYQCTSTIHHSYPLYIYIYPLYNIPRGWRDCIFTHFPFVCFGIFQRRGRVSFLKLATYTRRMDQAKSWLKPMESNATSPSDAPVICLTPKVAEFHNEMKLHKYFDNSRSFFVFCFSQPKFMFPKKKYNHRTFCMLFCNALGISVKKKAHHLASCLVDPPISGPPRETSLAISIT